MKPKHLLPCMLFLILSGCVTIVKWKYGITNPKEQTPEKLLSFLEQHQYPDSCIYIFGDTLSYFQNIRNPTFRKHLLSNMVFDCKGSLLQHDTLKCQWSGYEMIKALDPDSTYLKQNGLQVDEVLGHLRLISADSSQYSKVQHPDFTVIVTWAKFLGTYNAHLFELSDAIKQNKAARIRLIWLNIDMQQCWHLSRVQKLAIR